MIDEYFIEVDVLRNRLAESCLKIIDVRDPEEYCEGHIPGAVNVREIFDYLVTHDNGGCSAMQEYFLQLFRDKGITGHEEIIIYEDAMDSSYAVSCRGWFILKHLGHPHVRVLHGGFQAWLLQSNPINREIPFWNRGLFEPCLDHSMILTAEEMLASLTDPAIIKVDCRDRAEWVGFSSSPYGPDFAPQKGRIPGAVWIEWYQLMRRDHGIPWLRSGEELKSLFAEAGITPESTVYLYCFKGARTSLMYIAMKIAGIQQVRNYFGAWNEWSRIPEMPVDRGYPAMHSEKRK
jgi:thiosulfate/3-mercaptopyruvate sulfurtransferase